MPELRAPDPRGGTVWPTGSTHRVDPWAFAADAAGMPPAVAAHAIRVYTEPGATVLDPDCGTGAVLVEAVRAGRHAVGITGRRWWPAARASLTAAKRAGALADGMVLDPRSGSRPGGRGAGILAGLTGRVDLLLTTVRPGGESSRVRTRTRAGGPDPDRGPGQDPTRGPADRLAAVLVRSRPLLRPGGHVVIAARPARPARHTWPAWDAGRPVDLPAAVATAARGAGLIPVERCVALIAPPVPRRRAGRRGARPAVGLTAHLDVYVFRRPPEVEEPAAVALPVPPPPPIPAPTPDASSSLLSVPTAGRTLLGRWAA